MNVFYGDASAWCEECAREHYGNKAINALIAGTWYGKPLDAYNGHGPKDGEGNVLSCRTECPISEACGGCLSIIDPETIVTRMADFWPDAESWPDECPKCGADISEQEDMETCQACGYADLWQYGYPTCDGCQKHITSGVVYSYCGMDYCEQCASVA